jgi:hypothetical protein
LVVSQLRGVRFPYGAPMGCRVMATFEPPKLGREGSIPSQPANSRILNGAIFQQQNPALARQGSGCNSRSLHQCGVVAQRGEHFDGIEEVAGAIPVDSTMRVPNGWHSVFQTDDEGSIPSIRSHARETSRFSWRGSPSAKRQARVRFPLGSLRNDEWIMTLYATTNGS